MPQKIESPNEAELRWLDQNLARLREYAKKPVDHRFTMGELDDIYHEWFCSRGDADPNPMINSFGTAYGQRLVEDLSMTWVVVTDEHGTEIAVCGQPGDVLVFPPNLVAKRFVAKEVGFFATLHGVMIREIEELRRETRPKPWWRFW